MKNSSKVWAAIVGIGIILAIIVNIHQIAEFVSPLLPKSVNPNSSFECPTLDQVANWTNIPSGRLSQLNENCAFKTYDIGQMLSGVVCTNEDGGATIEYTPTSQTNTLVIKSCDGNQLSDTVWGFTIRFVQLYPGGDADVCSLDQHARQQLSGWTILPQANCG